MRLFLLSVCAAFALFPGEMFAADSVAPEAKKAAVESPAPVKAAPVEKTAPVEKATTSEKAVPQAPATENEGAKTEDAGEAPAAEEAKKNVIEQREVPELRRYRVLVRLMVNGDSRISSQEAVRALSDEVDEALARLWGECWEVTVQTELQLQPVEMSALEGVTTEWLLAHPPEKAYDKQFVALVAPQGGLWQVASREWDVASQRLTEVATREGLEIRELPDAAAEVMSSQFHPLLVVQDVDRTTIYFRPWGGAYKPADPGLKLFEGKTYWLPFYRTRVISEEGPAKEMVQMIPWTYLELESFPNPQHQEGKCKLITGLRNPVAPSRGPLAETLAIGVTPPGPETRVTLLSKDEFKRPLAGTEVDLLPDEKTVAKTLLTDRGGAFVLTPDPKTPLIWFRARSGAQRLAQLPILPGAVSKVSLELPRDDIRLQTEAKLALVQAGLMETVAKRALLMARIGKVSKQADWKTVDQMVKDLRSLPTAENVVPELTAIRATAVTNAKKQNDKIAVKRIEKMCDETRELVDHYLQDDKVKQLIEEMEQLRKVTKKAEDDLAKEDEDPLAAPKKKKKN